MKLTKHAATFAALTACTALFASPASAAPILGFGAPITNSNLVGGTVVDFTTAPLGSAAVRTFGNLTITGVTRVQDEYTASLNMTGRSLDNQQGATPSFVLSFLNPVSAFALNIGAINSPLTISAGGQTYVYGVELGNAGNYYGITGVGLTSATITMSGGDWVLFDNITFKEQAVSGVPEAATWAMMLLGFGAIGGTLRRRQKVGARVRFA